MYSSDPPPPAVPLVYDFFFFMFFFFVKAIQAGSHRLELIILNITRLGHRSSVYIYFPLDDLDVLGQMYR